MKITEVGLNEKIKYFLGYGAKIYNFIYHIKYGVEIREKYRF